MGRIPERLALTAAAACMLLLGGCGAKEEPVTAPETPVYGSETAEELYEKALDEDVLIVCTVSTRATEVKESFEKEYPGLSVEIRDLRSPNLIEAVEDAHEKGSGGCDVVLCNDNSGEFKTRLVDTGLVVPYLPADIAPKMKEGMAGSTVSFLVEAELLFYSAENFDHCPVDNIWGLTEERFKGRIYMPNPLNSFSTYAFCGASMQHDEELAEAYRDYFGEEPVFLYGETASECFWRKASGNIVFTNSSDEVVEALGNGNADLGFCVSSKLRYKNLGYGLEPVWKLEPFCGCRASFAVMLTADAENVNAAKLFIRYIMGEAGGDGEGYKPFCTEGTWSARTDVPDGSPVSLEDTDLLIPDENALAADRKMMESFWEEMIRISVE
ncbi:MAG: extracellular solute-binding protein [Lachnospiraceae bacterium]|nr:extracellular solute-binding protein [Lachnospiraceae bacterium]